NDKKAAVEFTKCAKHCLIECYDLDETDTYACADDLAPAPTTPASPGLRQEYAPPARPAAMIEQSKGGKSVPIQTYMRSTFGKVSVPALSVAKFRNARLPFPPSQIIDLYGYDFLFHIANNAHRSFEKDD